MMETIENVVETATDQDAMEAQTRARYLGTAEAQSPEVEAAYTALRAAQKQRDAMHGVRQESVAEAKERMRGTIRL